MKLFSVLALIVAAFATQTMNAAPKVIIDTDFNTIGDDGQVAAMAAQLDASGQIDLLGFTVPSGNQWRDQGVSDCLKAVERLGIERSVRVYRGARFPLLHDYKAYLLEQALFGPATDYVGAYARPEPSPNDLVSPPDGFAQFTRPARRDAVDFLVSSIHRYPHEVTLLAIAPLTNIALAIRKDPSIVPLIKRVVFMGGQVYAPGNAYRDAGEFNWWFDPEAVQVVLRADVDRYIVPLDCTNRVPLTKDTYLAITQHQPQTAITKLYANEFAPFFGSAPAPYPVYIYDTIALVYAVDPSIATDVRNIWLDIDSVTASTNTTFGPLYGKTIPSTVDPTPTSHTIGESKVIFDVNKEAFSRKYVDLLTRPVPVKHHDSHEIDED